MAKFLTDLLSPQEIEMLAKRLQIAEYLLKGEQYTDIRAKLKVGFSTIARVATWLGLSGEGFKLVLSRKRPPKKEVTIEEKYDPFSSYNFKRRYTQYYWPQLLLEKIFAESDANHKRKITTILQSMEVKKELFSKEANKEIFASFFPSKPKEWYNTASMDYQIRQATRKELDTAVKWAAAEGWNPGLHDASVFWKTDPKGFFVIEKDKLMIGSVSGVSYNDKFGFGGFFIIKKPYRNQGLGTKLADHFIKSLSSRLDKGAPIGIDGVFNMQPTYAKWGFKFSHRNLRMESVAKRLDFNSQRVEKIVLSDFDSILHLDEECFGFDRSVFLKDWLKMPDGLALKYTAGKSPKGYGVVRKCHKGFKIGPLFADNYSTANELFKGLSNYAAGKMLYLDTPEINSAAIKLAKEYQMKECFGCARMYLGPAPKLPYHKIFGVTTFELG